MAKKVGLITINLLAGTAQFNTQMAAATAQVKTLSGAVSTAQSHLVSGNQAAAGFIRVAENGMSNNLRAVENFMTRTLGLGPALQAIFPLVGATAFAGLLVSLGEKVYSFFKKAEEGAARVSNAFRTLNLGLEVSVDELRVRADRLEMGIAKLEGRRQNGLQLALDEARLAADKLSQSLERNISDLNKLLKDEHMNAFMSFFAGQQVDTGIREIMGGKSGQFGGYAGRVQAINVQAEKEIGDAADRGDKKAEDLAIARQQEALDVARTETIRKLTVTLEAYNYIAEDRKKLEALPLGMGIAVEAATPGLDNPAKAIEQTKGLIAALEKEGEEAKQSRRVAADEAKTARLEAANEASRLDRPLDNKLASLQADLQQAAEKLSTVHMSEDMKELAAAHGDAAKAIEQVNKALKALHEGPMSQADEDKIKTVETGIVTLKAEADWQTKMVASTAAIKDRIVSQQMLTAAIGQGYEATKKAAVEYEVMKAVGFEKFNDPKFMADPAHKAEIDQYRADAETAYEEKHSTQVEESLRKLRDHIALERNLATVQIAGAEAVRVVTLATEIENIRRDESVDVAKRLVKAKVDEYNAERANTNAIQLAVITHEIEATERLSAAQIEGAEAARRAGLETKYQAMQREGSAPENIAATRREDELLHQQKITEEVLKTANADRDRLREIDREEAKAMVLVGSAADQLGIMLKLRDLENERLTIIARELLEVGTLRDGFKAFFTEMEKEAEKPGKILFDGMNSAVNALSDNLSKLLTRQKTGWASMFKSIGTQMLKSSLDAVIHKGLGALGLGGGKPDGTSEPKALWVRISKALGLPGSKGLPGAGAAGKVAGALGVGGGRRDGQSAATAYYVVSVTEGGGGSSAGGLGALGSLAALFGGAGAGAAGAGGEGAVATAVDSSITFLAGGGDMSADKSYIVGDDGPEILSKTRGRVISNSDSKKLLGDTGGNHFYTIDARGTDPVLTEQRTKAAILAAHNSAIGKAVQVQQEHLKRTPQR